MKRTAVFSLLGVGALLAGVTVQLSSQEAPMPDVARLLTNTARFAPVEVAADISRLPAGEQKSLARMVEAGRIMDTLFLRQVWAANEGMLAQLQKDVSP